MNLTKCQIASIYLSIFKNILFTIFYITLLEILYVFIVNTRYGKSKFSNLDFILIFIGIIGGIRSVIKDIRKIKNNNLSSQEQNINFNKTEEIQNYNVNNFLVVFYVLRIKIANKNHYFLFDLYDKNRKIINDNFRLNNIFRKITCVDCTISYFHFIYSLIIFLLIFLISEKVFFFLIINITQILSKIF